MLPWANACLHQPPLCARRKPPARSAVVPLEEARSSSLGWEARAKAQRIVTSSSSVRVGAAVPPKSGCLRYWQACGRVCWVRCMSLKKLATLIDEFQSAAGTIHMSEKSPSWIYAIRDPSRSIPREDLRSGQSRDLRWQRVSTGRESTAKLEALYPKHPETGYVADLIVVVNPEITTPEVGMGGPPPSSL